MRTLQNNPSTIHLFTARGTARDEEENLVEFRKDLDDFVDMITEMDESETGS